MTEGAVIGAMTAGVVLVGLGLAVVLMRRRDQPIPISMVGAGALVAVVSGLIAAIVVNAVGPTPIPFIMLFGLSLLGLGVAYVRQLDNPVAPERMSLYLAAIVVGAVLLIGRILLELR
jgi:hypothetical protein